MKIKYKVIVVFIAGLFLISCNQQQKNEQKSELVKSLEDIFYDESFAKTQGTEFNVADYGAVGDGETLTTEAIQKTIDAAAEAGGGKVVFPEGVYLSGALFVKSNVEFHIAEGVTIKAIQDNQYYPRRETRVAGVEMMWPSALINVYGQKNVRITGKGTIDGNGKYWWDKFWGDPKLTGGMWVDYKKRNVRWAVDYDCERVRPVVVYESEDVLLKDFSVNRAGFWTVSLTYSTRVHVDGLVIRNNIGGHGPSSDGVNTDSSKDILVENCDIDCNDDNLCIKAGKDADGLRVNRPAENIVYRNCITRAGHGLITLGSETSGGMRNIEVYGLEAIGTNIGIRFKSAKIRGGIIENIWFHDIKIKDVGRPFNFELNWYPEYSYPVIPDDYPKDEIPEHWKVMTQRVVPAEKGIPEFRNIKLSNITVENAELGFYANAYPEKPIHDFVWEDIYIEAEESGMLNYASNWTMNNVQLKSKSGKPIELNNCTNIDQPELLPVDGASENISVETLGVEEQIELLLKENTDLTVVAINPSSNEVILDGDTTNFSDDMTIRVFNDNDASIKYFEPLGDDFYYSPIVIQIEKSAAQIDVKGQKQHTYTFLIDTPNKPSDIVNADSWSYDETTKQIRIEKEGKSFYLKMN